MDSDYSYSYGGLSADDDIAFIDLVKKYQKSYSRNVSEKMSYMNKVISAAKSLNIQKVKDIKMPPMDDYDGVKLQKYENFLHILDEYFENFKIINGRRVSKFSVKLSVSEKEKLRHFIEQIKCTVEISQLSTGKKEAIFKKLASLALEIDRDRTRFEAFADVVSDLAHVSRNLADGAEPWWKWAKPMFEILGSAKESEDQQAALPSPEEQKKLEPPQSE